MKCSLHALPGQVHQLAVIAKNRGLLARIVLVERIIIFFVLSAKRVEVLADTSPSYSIFEICFLSQHNSFWRATGTFWYGYSLRASAEISEVEATPEGHEISTKAHKMLPIAYCLLRFVEMTKKKFTILPEGRSRTTILRRFG
ncbi:MAG: hypothetical protein WKF89_18370 [Chitinophagaceae bacterium]